MGRWRTALYILASLWKDARKPIKVSKDTKIILIACIVTEILTKEGLTIMTAWKSDIIQNLKEHTLKVWKQQKSFVRTVLQGSPITRDFWEPNYVHDSEELYVAWLAKFFCSHHCRLWLADKDFVWTLGPSWRARRCVCRHKRFQPPLTEQKQIMRCWQQKRPNIAHSSR